MAYLEGTNSMIGESVTSVQYATHMEERESSEESDKDGGVPI
jgi:hypothetical protein